MSEDEIIRDTLRAFKGRELDALFEQCNAPSRDLYTRLWNGISEIGVPSLGLPDEHGGLQLGPDACVAIMSELGAGCPALAVGTILHLSAHAMLSASRPSLTIAPAIDKALSSARFTWIGSPLAPEPEIGFALGPDGQRIVLSGKQRCVQPFAEFLVLPALLGDIRKLVVLAADHAGLAYEGRASSHGLRLLPFGELVAEGVHVPAAQVLDWPTHARAQNRADGLLVAVLAGMVREMAQRASAYAIERYQGGKMIHEHDAVRQLVGPMLLAERALRAVALDTLADAQRDGDGGASAFAVKHVRQIGLDAIQVFGGYGYMEDYRVERYLRDANAIETLFVHAAHVEREIAARRFASLISAGAR